MLNFDIDIDEIFFELDKKFSSAKKKHGMDSAKGSVLANKCMQKIIKKGGVNFGKHLKKCCADFANEISTHLEIPNDFQATIKKGLYRYVLMDMQKRFAFE